MMIRDSISRAALCALMGAALVAGTGSAMAADSGGAAAEAGSGQQAQQQAPSPEAQKAMQARMRVQQLQQKLTKLQKQALDNNPDLQQQRDDLDETIQSRLKEEGVNPDEDMARMREIREEIRSGDVSKDKQQKLAQEFQQKRKNMMQARQAAMQDDEVKSSRKTYRDSMIAAMKDEDPKAEELIAKYRQAIQDFRQSRRNATQGGGGAPSGGDS